MGKYLEKVKSVVSDRERILQIRQRQLATVLRGIYHNDTNYTVRYGLVLAALSWAHQAGLKSGVRFDPENPEWPVAFIELPQGQVSWHLPHHETPWDGHTTEKYVRCAAFCRDVTGYGLELKSIDDD